MNVSEIFEKGCCALTLSETCSVRYSIYLLPSGISWRNTQNARSRSAVPYEVP